MGAKPPKRHSDDDDRDRCPPVTGATGTRSVEAERDARHAAHGVRGHDAYDLPALVCELVKLFKPLIIETILGTDKLEPDTG